jgi:hypothetical protein
MGERYFFSEEELRGFLGTARGTVPRTLRKACKAPECDGDVELERETAYLGRSKAPLHAQCVKCGARGSAEILP